MTTYRVRSTDGNNADNGSTWALAKADVHTSAWAPGDLIYVSQAHAQSTAAAITIATSGSLDTPTKILGVSDVADPPTAMSSAPTVTTTGASDIAISGSAYVYGLTFNAGSGASLARVLQAPTNGTSEQQVFDTCAFAIVGTSTTGGVNIGGTNVTTGKRVEWRNCNLKLAAAAQQVRCYGATFCWRGGSIVSGSSSPTTNGLLVIGNTGRTGMVCVEDVDFANFSTTVAFINSGSYGADITLRNCKLPAGWTGSLFTAAPTQAGIRGRMINCDSGDTNYRLWVEDFTGVIRDETTVVRTGGATDGTTPIAWKMTTTASANELVAPLVSDPIFLWNDTVGSSKTLTVEVLHDSATNLTDADIWVEVEYLGTSGFPIGSMVSDRRANPLTTAADQTASTVTWTTTGLTNPNKQKLEVSFTPQEKGLVVARVCVGKASKTVYVCPKAALS